MFCLVGSVFGEWCEEVLLPLKECDMATPPLDCVNASYFIYNLSEKVEEGTLISIADNLYYLSINLSAGDYLVKLCDNSTREIYVQAEDTNMLSIIILIPLVFGFFMLIGAMSLGQDHQVLKIALFLLSPITIWVSFHYAMIALVSYYGLTELQDAIGTTTYWMAWMFFLLLAYFIIYAIWKATNVIAQKKNERLQY